MEGFQNPIVVLQSFDFVTELAVFIRAVVPKILGADVKVRAVFTATSLVETAADNRRASEDDSANVFIGESLEASLTANLGITLAVETVVEVAVGLPWAAPSNEILADMEERALVILTAVCVVLPVLKADTSIFVVNGDKLDLPVLLKGKEPVGVFQPLSNIFMAEAFEKIPLLRQKSAQLGPSIELPQQEDENLDPLVRTQLRDSSLGLAVLGLLLLVLVHTFSWLLFCLAAFLLPSLCPTSPRVFSLLWLVIPATLAGISVLFPVKVLAASPVWTCRIDGHTTGCLFLIARLLILRIIMRPFTQKGRYAGRWRWTLSRVAGPWLTGV